MKMNKYTLKQRSAALGLLQVDQHGLDYIDHKMMNCIIKQYNGGPVGTIRLP
ncbi:hypothetical protein ACVNP1_09280 [Staphylococcus aureus]